MICLSDKKRPSLCRKASRSPHVRVAFLFFVVLSLGFFSCDSSNGTSPIDVRQEDVGSSGGEQSDGGEPVDSGGSGDGGNSGGGVHGVPVQGAADIPSIKAKFGVMATGTAGVTAAFNELHKYIANGGLNRTDNVIHLGDWIDLEGGLTVESYNGAGGFDVENTDITPSQLPFDGYEGKLLRLIVVGINSFHSGKGANGQYTVTVNNGVLHVVFQFQNVPVKRRMEVSDTNQNGYLGSEMREYLAHYFLPGLIEAGVPENVIWGPTRYVANKGSGATGADTITDKLWLPTERELFGAMFRSVDAQETAANQARLEYYTDGYKRIKCFSGNYWTWYWEASPYSGSASYFCYVINSGNYDGYTASTVGGCAPAFCVR